jgi:hypothetical protein
MERKLTVMFRRDAAKDRQREEIRYEGYDLLWPDGRPVGVGIDAFCKHGQRLLGLGKYLAGCSERLVELACYPLCGREADLTRLPGCRVRRFFLERTGHQGRIHFLDGTPTAAVFDLHHDEPTVLQWIGLPHLGDGERQWLDVAARAI